MEKLLQTILAEVQHLRKDVDTLSNRIDMVATMTAKEFNKVEARFERLEGRFDALENRFNGLEKRFDGLEKKTDKLTEEFHVFRRETERSHGIMEGKLDKLNVRLFELEGIVAQNTTEIKDLQEEVFNL